MKIVIDIPEEYYKNLLNNYSFSSEEIPIISLAIATGTPLPKGHGRLIDADKLQESQFYSFNLPENHAHRIGYKERNLECQTDITNAPTIIEADKDGDADG